MTACLVVGIVVTPADSAAPTRNRGYWIAGANAQVFAFGDAQLYAQRVRRQVRGQIADIAAHPSGRGYWLLGRDGAVYAYGEARDLGQDSAREQDAVAIASTPTGNGYFVVTERGEVHGFGDAVARGSRSARERGEERKIVDIATTPSGGGYWLVDANGQVSAFGDAIGFGSLPRTGHDEEDDRSGDDRSDIVAIGATARGDGYWLASASGQVFAFGAAPRFAPLADPARGRHDEEDNERKAKKIVDLTTTWTGRGYWLVDRDGLVFAFGDAALYGELARRDLRSGQVVAIVSTPFVNHDPVAVNDTAALDEDTTVDINVLANDTDEDGDPLTGAVLTQPAHGTATLNPDGTIRYAPAHDYNGSDAFTYRVTDGFGGSATGTVRLTVRPVNDAPIAFDDAFTIDEDTALSDSVTKNDTDVDGDALTGRLVTAPAHGVATLGADGTFTYTPAANYNGDDSFTYRAFDGVLESGTAATVYIHINAVNDAPVGAADTATVNEDEVLTVAPPGVLANDTDVESDPLTVSLVSGPAHGTLSLTPNGGYT
ncbi:MAG TPA: Ig-like domain-containing protein, partial [Candidatus Limnocylindria bacterium]|nr:Ig-like domain-containing protein [Candidatus Limnocylindria bacterium]